jgi:glycosyltransferase involved in cell wall biosynthesis
MILFLNGRFLVQPASGVQRAARETVLALDRILVHHEGSPHVARCELLAPRGAPDLPLAAIRLRRVGRLQGHAWEQIELPWHARLGFLMGFGNTAPLALRSQMLTIHDAGVFAVPEAYTRSFRAWYRLLQPLLARRARALVTDSEFSRGELVRYLGASPDRVYVAPLGAEHVLRTPADRGVLARHGLEGSRFVLGVGNQSPHKGWATLVAAFESLPASSCRLVLAGGGLPGIFRDEGLGERDGRGRVLTLGRVTDGELRALYEAATCLVFPSRYEGFGLPALEAMACGCPTIVSRRASLPEVCGDAARYVDPGDPAGIAAAIALLLADPAARADLAARGRARAATYTWERTARCLLGALFAVG